LITVTKKDEVHLLIETDPSTAKEIVDFFTFEVPGARFMPAYRNRMWDGKVRLFNMYTRELYLGLLDYLKEFADQLEYKIKIDMEDVGEPISSTYINNLIQELNLQSNGRQIEIRDYQLDAVSQAIRKGRCLLLSPTGSGKSLIIFTLVHYHSKLGRKQLIVVPTTSLVEQMYGDFADYASAIEWDVSKNCHRIYSGKEKSNEAPIVISTWQSIYKFPKSWFDSFDVIYGDEAHLFKAKSLTTLMDKLTHTPYRIGTTGTLDGAKTNKLVLEGVFGPVHKVTTTKKLMDDKQLADLKIVCLLIEYPDEQRKVVSKMTYQEEIDWIISNPKRNNILTNLALSQTGNTLLLYQFVEKHGKILYNLIRDKAKENRKVFFVYGGTDAEQRNQIRGLTEKEKDAIIIASYGTFSTGINIRNLHNVIFASPSKSRIRNLQSIGRGLRQGDQKETCNLFDVGDDLSWKSKRNFTLDHMLERIKLYNEESFKYKVAKVQIND
tara:strand:+ start:14268 stop:15749 length:1482 start_codon:yes stop_codon:yes gene_type:complete